MRVVVLIVCLAGVAAAATSAAVAGPTASPLGRKEFLARADAVCADYGARVDRLLAATPAADPTLPGTPDAVVRQWAPAIAKVLAVRRGELRELRRLEPPLALRQDFAAALRALAAGIDALAPSVPAMRRADRAAIAAALGASAPETRRASAIVGRLGLRVCGSN